ncbi:hypothetical protein ERO13_D05G187100v2 [Gossypium hirsutum]|uniref:UPF0496 protein At1g20180 n=3 Tax=Gossypium TaxID=3633 RepID=A0A1U8JG25_GOSHI|nr:UPF0496 protein At1g20180-like [Gossypium hirsutum]KAB2029904.1 hypothetical protein ES319_D05G193300v1 [Gossypium barbadense]KAG4146884.1 hypothetical protein ERO13_D05G187100v2 [Gossypium hirsutum]TYH71701.1 hypothetical protein ES332_D05G202600v1 [Gossypium tomentosum]
MFQNMSRGTNMIQTKLKSGRSKTERGGGSYLEEKANVNEEYKEVFRTKSYLETWTKVHGQLENTSFDRLSPSSSIPNHRINLSEYLLQPKQETLDKIESLNFHHLILDYFEAGLEGSNLCESLLRSIHQARVYYRKIRRVIKISKRIDQEFSDDKCSVIFKELAGFALLKNPFSIISPVQLRDFHESNLDLFHKLTSRREKLKRQAKFKRISKQIGSICLVISHTAFIIALLVLAFHGMIGIIAAPGLAACFFGMRLKKKKKKSRSQSNYQQGLERLCAQLDISAKGVYILINDFDTISRLVWRLHDEIEHRKAIADMCIRNGKIEVLKEVVRELCMHDSSFLEQLKELEEHTKLCFHTINRSRKLVIQEIVDAEPLY